MNALSSTAEKQIQYHPGVCDGPVIAGLMPVAIVCVTVLVVGILANLHAQGVLDCRPLGAISWGGSVALLVVGGWFLFSLICATCSITARHYNVKFSESDSEWTPKKNLLNSYTFLGSSISVTQEHGSQEMHLFPSEMNAHEYIDKLIEKNYCQHSKLAAETGATIHKHVEDSPVHLTLDTFIEYILDVEPWERAFQGLPPEENAYAFYSHEITAPVPQDVTLYSVLSHVGGERAIHFFMNQALAREYILTLGA